jgi:hypothetical protein
MWRLKLLQFSDSCVELCERLGQVYKSLVGKFARKNVIGRSRRRVVDSIDSVRFHVLMAVTKSIIVLLERNAV